MEEQFGTQYYMAPEIILMGDCRKPVDIWALGCSLFELLTGKILFNPDDEKYDNEDMSTDEKQLNLMIELCGNFNHDFLKNTNYYRKFFDKKGKINNKFKNYNHESKKEQLVKKLKENNLKEIDMIADLLDKMIILSPSKRIKIKDILDHPWIN